MQMVGQLKSIRQKLNVTVDSQTIHRQREARGRSFAESLNERVQYWSTGLSVLLVVVAIIQVAVVRGFFVDADKRRPWCHMGLGL